MCFTQREPAERYIALECAVSVKDLHRHAALQLSRNCIPTELLNAAFDGLMQLKAKLLS